MNDYGGRRRHARPDSENGRAAQQPQWPTGADPDQGPGRVEPQESTGYWSPTFDDEDDRQPVGGTRGNVSSGPDGGIGGRLNGGGPPATAPPPRAGAAAGGPPRGGPPPPPPPRPPQEPHDRPTELLPPIPTGFGSAPESSGLGREPELLTHVYNRETSYNDEWDGEWDDEWDEWDDDDDPEDDELTDEERAKRKKKVWRRARRIMYALAALFILGPIAVFAVLYMIVDVPSPEQVAAQQNQVVTLQYANGKEMSQIIPEEGNRKIVQPEDVPEQVKHAAYAAEDATFESNAGFDISAIMRAGWNQLTGGGGGGSTISQQYIKKATENEEYSLKRKALEVVKSYKMNNELSKREIITAYLNTIYFGRGANGIQAASKAYFNKDDLRQLTKPESALLTGMIQSPGRADDMVYMKQRWNYVMDQMVANKWMTPQERQSAKFPQPISQAERRKNLNRAEGPEGLIEQRVLAELQTEAGLTEDQVQHQGLTIKTTIDPAAQKAAVKAVDEVMNGQPQNLRNALTAIDPKSGGVRAYYGGKDALGLDYAQSLQEPGSSFKPFDLVALLRMNKGLGETYDGSSPRTIAGTEVNNSEGVNCARCTVATAMEKSINTVFVDMAVNTTGTKAVAKAAHDAGIPKMVGDQKLLEGLDGGSPDANIAIGGGRTQVRTIDMAAAYATFAADGQRRKPHFVAEAKNAEGEVVHVGPNQSAPALDSDPERSKQIAGNVTDSLRPVVPYSELSCPGEWDCVGKTGTHQYVDPSGEKTDDNSKAWMVGYTRSISAAVWVGSDKNEPILDSDGSPVYGSGLPGEMWQTFMDAYHANKPPEKFPEVDPIGKYARADEEYQTPTSSAPPSTSSEPSEPSPTQPSPTPPPSQTTPPSTEPEEPTEEPTEPPIIGGPPDEDEGNGAASP
ncbi:MAG: penicillin-binding protein [Pseudonocardiaceae bacterium]|nr:penicillin-binding protein [Pseudonocardiaceae bacterium]